MSKVELAAAEDVQAIIELNRQIQSLHAALYPEDFKQQVDPAERQTLFARIMADDAHAVAVYRDAGRVEGYVWLELRERPETALMRAAKTIHIHHIVVAEMARRQRIGSETMRWVEAYAAAAGVRRIVLEHWAANEAAQAFFSRSGFLPVKVTLRKEAVDAT